MHIKHKAKQKKSIFIDIFKNHISTIKDTLPTNIYKKKCTYATDSWFTTKYYKVNNVSNNTSLKNKFPKEYIKSTKVTMILTDTQKQILNKWFTANTDMYNATLDYLRINYPLYKETIIRDKLKALNIKESTNFIFLRGKLKDIRDRIQSTSGLLNTRIYTHILDCAIKQVTTNLKSAITNTLRGNFKRFRIKFWKYTRPSQTLDIELSYIRNNQICPYVFGDIKYIYNKKDYILPQITCGIKINYNKITNEYSLLIPEKLKPIQQPIKHSNIISLDPGLRTFMTGLSENNAIKIGENVNKIVALKLKRLNKITNNENIPQKIKKKNTQMINRKIEHMIDDLHWKTIGHLTNNYSNILLGNMSAKSIVKKNQSVLSSIQKTACLRTRYYVFQQRLAYKCIATKTNFKLVDEMYTSKICSSCGNYNEKLKGEKIYNCESCLYEVDRDINGCRNIYFKSLL